MNSPKSEPADSDEGGLGGRRMGEQPKPEYNASGGKLLRKWQAIRAAASDKRLSAAADLRVLVAIVDRMNDKLEAWPGYGTIGRDVGIDRRTASRSVDRLVETGYLVKTRASSRNSNTYRLIRLSVDSPTGKITPGVSVDSPGVSVDSPTGGVGEFAPGVSVDSPSEPGNRNRVPLNPEKEAGEANPARAREDQPLPPPSFEQIVKTYHDILPELPRVEVITKERKELMRERCRKELPDIEEWTDYLQSIRRSDFLMGRKVPRDDRHSPFQANFDFLIRERTLVSHSEGKYLDPTPGQHRGASRRELT